MKAAQGFSGDRGAKPKMVQLELKDTHRHWDLKHKEKHGMLPCMILSHVSEFKCS